MRSTAKECRPTGIWTVQLHRASCSKRNDAAPWLPCWCALEDVLRVLRKLALRSEALVGRRLVRAHEISGISGKLKTRRTGLGSTVHASLRAASMAHNLHTQPRFDRYARKAGDAEARACHAAFGAARLIRCVRDNFHRPPRKRYAPSSRLLLSWKHRQFDAPAIALARRYH